MGIGRGYWTVQRVFFLKYNSSQIFRDWLLHCTCYSSHPTVYGFLFYTICLTYITFLFNFFNCFYLFIFIDMSRECSHLQPQTSFQRLIHLLGKIMEQYTVRIRCHSFPSCHQIWLLPPPPFDSSQRQAFTCCKEKQLRLREREGQQLKLLYQSHWGVGGVVRTQIRRQQ